jgi:hypothetical protein
MGFTEPVLGLAEGKTRGLSPSDARLRPARDPRSLADLLNSSLGLIKSLDTHFFDDQRKMV